MPPRTARPVEDAEIAQAVEVVASVEAAQPPPVSLAPPPLPPRRPALQRPRECVVSGVSAGLALHLGLRVAVVRALFTVLTFFGGFGALFYIWLWAFTPWEDTRDAASVPSRRAPVAWILVGLSVVGLCAVFGLAVSAGSGATMGVLAMVIPAALAAAAGLWATLVDRADPARGPRHEVAVRVSVTGVLVVLFVLALSAQHQAGVSGFVTALVPLIGIAIVFSSTLIEKWRALSGERVRRIREEQRSEMAAHLHDSVMQTLALIQHKAGASTEVARLARAQERELRAWLYDGDSPADSDLPTDLRDYAGALELDFPVRIDVVSAGLSTERASGEVAAAAREAMLNAARHAGGDVAVYIEGTMRAVDVYIRDRGPGFALDAVPGDRLGVRESIIGRMRRAGGSATVKAGAAGVGTEVHLHIALEENRG